MASEERSGLEIFQGWGRRLRESRRIRPDLLGMLMLLAGIAGYPLPFLPHLGRWAEYYLDIRGELIGIGGNLLPICVPTFMVV